MTCGSTPICARLVANVLLRSCSVQFSTPLNMSRVTLLFDQPLNGDELFPRAGNSRLPEVSSTVNNDEARLDRGNACSLPFFVRVAGRVMESFCIHEV